LAVVTAATVIVAGVGPVWVPVLVRPPFLEIQVAVWLEMALPLLAPTAKVTLSEPVVVLVDPDTALTAAGAAGAPTTTGREEAEARLAPRALLALTVHV
jgi:hypothetical protein